MKLERMEDVEKVENNENVEETEKTSLGEKFSQAWNSFKDKFKNNEETEKNSENEISENDNNKKENPEGTKYDLNTNDGRRKYREDAISKMENQLFDTVVKHGEMLKNRNDISPYEKDNLQAEITEKAKKTLEEYKNSLENDPRYKDLN